MQILDADGTRFDGLESRACEQSHDLREIDVTVSMAQLPLAPPQGEPYDRIVEQRSVQDRGWGREIAFSLAIVSPLESGHLSDFECTLPGNAEKERKDQFVRYRTLVAILSGSSAREARKAESPPPLP